MNASTGSKITREAIKIVKGLLVILCGVLYGSLAESHPFSSQGFFMHFCCRCSSYPGGQGSPPAPHSPLVCNLALLTARCSETDQLSMWSKGKVLRVCSELSFISQCAEEMLHPFFLTPSHLTHTCGTLSTN